MKTPPIFEIMGVGVVKGKFVINTAPQNYHPETFRLATTGRHSVYGNSTKELAAGLEVIKHNIDLCYPGKQEYV